MLREAHGIQKIVLRAGRTDMRLGIDKLVSMLVADYDFHPMEDGGLYLFSGARKDTIKGLTYDKNGFLIFTKRLALGTFQWPRNTKDALEITREDYERLMNSYSIEGFIDAREIQGVC